MDNERSELREERGIAVAWVVESVARLLGVSVDPVSLFRSSREALPENSPTDAALAAAVGHVAQGVRLRVVAVPFTEAGVDSAVLPTFTASRGGVLLVERRGNSWKVLRSAREPSWMTTQEVLALGVPADAWFQAIPAAPLDSLHHPSTWQRLRALIHLERDDLQIIVIYAAVVGLLTLATPVAVQALVGSVAFGTLLQPIVVLSLLFFAALGFQATLRGFQVRVVEAIQVRLFVRAAADLAWRLPRVRRAEVGHQFGPETVNRFFEVLNVQKAFGTLLTEGLATALQIVIGLIVLAFYHPVLLAFDLVLIGLVALVVAPFRRGLGYSLEESAAKYELVAWLQELARPGSALRSESGASFAAERADALTSRYIHARSAHFKVFFGQTMGALAVHVFASTALLGLGGWLVLQHSLTLGQLVAAELIVTAVASSISKLGKLLDATYDALTGLEKLGHLVDLPIERGHGTELVDNKGPMRVEVLGAAEAQSGAPCTCTVAPGARVAFVGADGHALVDWLAGLKVPTEGSVCFNGVEVARCQATSLREHVALVRRGDIFEGTLLENVSLNRPGVGPEHVRKALEQVGLLAEVRALPLGLDTELAHDGAPLTHSQLTRLLIARAIVDSPRMIVMEESLESLAPSVRAQCVAALTSDSARWTLVAFVADARDTLAAACTRVVNLDELRGA